MVCGAIGIVVAIGDLDKPGRVKLTRWSAVTLGVWLGVVGYVLLRIISGQMMMPSVTFTDLIWGVAGLLTITGWTFEVEDEQT